MIDLGKKLKTAREKTKMSQRRLAEMMKVSQQTVASWESNRTVPKTEYWKRIEYYLGIPSNVIAKAKLDGYDSSNPEVLKEVSRNFKPSPMSIPVVGHVEAGDTMPYFYEDHELGAGFDEVEVPYGLDPESRAVRVKGDSMFPYLRDGAVLIVKTKITDMYEMARYLGEMVICKTADDKYYVKTLARSTTKSPKLPIYNLLSINYDDLEDQVIEWIMPIEHIIPNRR